MSRYNFKIVLLGEGRVGKTSLVLRYVNNVFSDKQQSTMQASFLSKRLNINAATVNLAIWDTAGQERFHALGPIYYRDADGALLVYDITDSESFVKVKNWVKELRKMVGNDIVIAIAGNKSDLEKNRQVEIAAAEEYARSVGAVHFSTSAKTNKGTDDVFLDLSKRIIEQKGAKKASGSTTGGVSGKVNIVDDDPAPKAEKGGCC